jgi:hypothetical protein
VCYNCGESSHIARNCRSQQSYVNYVEGEHEFNSEKIFEAYLIETPHQWCIYNGISRHVFGEMSNIENLNEGFSEKSVQTARRKSHKHCGY